MDVAGDNQLNIEHEMAKQRLSPDGRLVGDSYVELIGQVCISFFSSSDSRTQNIVDATPVVDPNACGSCYGAESETWKCCNSCDELKMAYDAKGWANTMILRTAEQCLKDRRNPFANVKPGEGCRVSGTMVVNKVAGNFHMTLGESFVRDGAHIHQFIPAEAPGFNVSHTIHSLSFGDTYPSMPPNPLDNGESGASHLAGPLTRTCSGAVLPAGAWHWALPVFHQGGPDQVHQPEAPCRYRHQPIHRHREVPPSGPRRLPCGGHAPGPPPFLLLLTPLIP
jgi:hypothetical protein